MPITTSGDLKADISHDAVSCQHYYVHKNTIYIDINISVLT